MNENRLYSSYTDKNGNTLITMLYEVKLTLEHDRVLVFTQLLENSRFNGVPLQALPEICRQVAKEAEIRGECDCYVEPDVNRLYAKRLRLPHE